MEFFSFLLPCIPVLVEVYLIKARFSSDSIGTYFASMHLESPMAYNGLDHGFRNNLIVLSVSYDDDYREERK